MKLFDQYFGLPPFQPEKRYRKSQEFLHSLSRGIRIQALHHLSEAAGMLFASMGWKKDLAGARPLRLNPWFVQLGELARNLPAELALAPGVIPEPYAGQLKLQEQAFAGRMIRQSMRHASHASSNDGRLPRLYGLPLTELMKGRSFAACLILYWTGALPREPLEERLVEMTLIASLTNGPGTISAQGAKLSASAGNSPNAAMIGTLACTGSVHGGNGAAAVEFLLHCFARVDLSDPYAPFDGVEALAARAAAEFKKRKAAAKEAGQDYERIPCLGHPVFRDEAVNYDPRERVIYGFVHDSGKSNVFLEFYHALARALKANGSTANVLAVNVDAAVACVWLAICWHRLHEKQMTLRRARDIPFIAFALGRAAGGAGEYLDHQDFGAEMDMRLPVSECRSLTRPRELPPECTRSA
jgi:hypothetical protein